MRNKQVFTANEKNVKKALLCHIHTDIYDNYIEHLVDGDTSLIEEDIPTVHENLFLN